MIFMIWYHLKIRDQFKINLWYDDIIQRSEINLIQDNINDDII